MSILLAGLLPSVEPVDSGFGRGMWHFAGLLLYRRLRVLLRAPVLG